MYFILLSYTNFLESLLSLEHNSDTVDYPLHL